jgi:hypothetical protein
MLDLVCFLQVWSSVATVREFNGHTDHEVVGSNFLSLDQWRMKFPYTGDVATLTWRIGSCCRFPAFVYFVFSVVPVSSSLALLSTLETWPHIPETRTPSLSCQHGNRAVTFTDDNVSSVAPQRLVIGKISQHFGLETHDPTQIFFFTFSVFWYITGVLLRIRTYWTRCIRNVISSEFIFSLKTTISLSF